MIEQHKDGHVDQEDEETLTPEERKAQRKGEDEEYHNIGDNTR